MHLNRASIWLLDFLRWTGWQLLDPILGIAIAMHIARVGVELMRGSIMGLLDTQRSQEELQAITKILEKYADQGLSFRVLRPRQAGSRVFVTVNIQMPGRWSIRRGHQLAHIIQQDICRTLPSASVITHLEPTESTTPRDDECGESN